ncbi:hypothetical protein LIP_0663 [Limnochorda pilosa]|uniref:Methyltransferase type 11 domain-containing protein n=1 Tax=Limnochorda pilosa TaxID=1555112 RepID=A0A0K2SHF2_LIMPI|nr:hypothetical protein LIP_0663 [Limnochorda pilosa]
MGPTGEVVGVDISRENVAACGKIAGELGLAGRVRFLEGDATALPFPDAAFDVVLFRSLLPYVDRKDRVAEACARVLRPGGRIALVEPISRRFRWFSPTVGEAAPVEVRRTPGTWRRRLRWRGPGTPARPCICGAHARAKRLLPSRPISSCFAPSALPHASSRWSAPRERPSGPPRA